MQFAIHVAGPQFIIADQRGGDNAGEDNVLIMQELPGRLNAEPLVSVLVSIVEKMVLIQEVFQWIFLRTVPYMKKIRRKFIIGHNKQFVRRAMYLLVCALPLSIPVNVAQVHFPYAHKGPA